MNLKMNMNMNSIPCQFHNHQNHKILTICLNKNCNSKRLCCLQCLGEFHSQHLKDLAEIDTLNNFIDKSCNKQVEYPQSYTYGQCQLIENLKELLKVIDCFQKTINEEIENLKQQNLQEYLKPKSNSQFGFEFWNQFIEGMLQFVEAKQQLVNSQQLYKDKLNAVEVRQIEIINQAKESLTSIQTQFLKSFKQKQLKFSEVPIKLEGHQGNVIGVAISQDSNLIASGSDDNTAKLWSAKTQQLLQTFQYTGAVYGVALSPNNQYIAYGGSGDYSIQLYDLIQNAFFWTLVGHNQNILSIVFSSDSQYLFSGGQDNRLIIWNLNQIANIHIIETDSNIWTIVGSYDNKIISCICDQSINIWDLSTKVQLIHSRNPHQTGYGLSTSKDSSIFVSSGSDGQIKIWNFNDNENENNSKSLTLNKQIQAVNNTIYNVLLTPDEQYIVSICNQEKKIMIHHLQSGNLIQELHYEIGEYLNGYISLSNDMNVLVSAGEDSIIKLWMRE